MTNRELLDFQMIPTLLIITVLLLISTLLPIARHSHWVVRGFDFPRLQIGCLSALVLFAHLFFLDLHAITTWVLLTATTFCMIWQFWWIMPYTFLWPKEVIDSVNEDSAKKLSILTSNVLTTNRNVEALICLVQKHQPDILVTLETNQWWEEKLKVIEEDMPHSIKCPQDNLYGMHVFSRLPIIEEEICFLVENDVPSIHALVRARSGEEVRVHFVHPAPPSPTENDESVERDAELIVIAGRISESKQPIIIAGDLNDVAWSATTRLFRKISGLLDPRIGRGMFNTFHVDYPFLRWPLDHLFHSKHFTLQSLERLPSIGSDHFPLLTRLVLNMDQGFKQEGLKADKEDLDWATEISQQQDVNKNDVPQPGK